MRGAFERVDELEIQEEGVAFAGAPPVPAAMQRLARTAGSFDTEGWMDCGNYGKLDLTGTETVAVRFGRHVLEKRVVGSAGDSPPWKSLAFTTWNLRGRRYDTVTFSNHGEVSTTETRFADDDTLIVTAMNLHMGQPMLGRSIVTLGEHGPTVVDAHTIEGAGEPTHSFHMNYTPRK